MYNDLIAWEHELQQIKRPEPSDYGLAQSEVKRIPDWVTDSGQSILVSLLLVFLMLIAFTNWSFLGILMFMIFPGLFLALILSGIWHLLRKTWKLRVVRGYAETQRLQAALSKYEDEVAEFFDRKLASMGLPKREQVGKTRHDSNLRHIAALRCALNEASLNEAEVVSTRRLSASKSRIRAAVLDELFAAYLCEKPQTVDALEAGLLELATFQDIDKDYAIDPLSKVAAASLYAKTNGIEIPPESIARATSRAVESKEFAELEAWREQILTEQKEGKQTVSCLEEMAATVKHLDIYRVWKYENYFQNG